MRSILIFGAGDNQIWLIKSCRELQFYTHVVDLNKDAPGKEFADEFHVLKSDDVKGHIKLIEEKNIEGIVTCQMENPLYLMAELADYFRFNFPSKESIQKARDKYLMKQAFVEHDVPCAKGNIIQSTNTPNFVSIKDDLGLPFVIKPLDSFSSRGVYVINSEKEFNKFISKTLSFSKSGKILIEEFLEGPEVSVEGVVFNNKVSIVQITDKVIADYPYTVELAHIQPSHYPVEVKSDINQLVKAAVSALGLNQTGFHAEIKITPQGLKMVEIGARLGGDYISSYLTYNSCGVDLNKAVAQIALNISPNLNKGCSRHAMVAYYNWESGKVVKSVHSTSLIEDIDGVEQIKLFIQQGQKLPFVTDSSKRHAVYVISADNQKDLYDLNERVKDNMKYLIETI